MLEHPVPGPCCPPVIQRSRPGRNTATMLESCRDNVDRAAIRPSVSFLSVGLFRFSLHVLANIQCLIRGFF